MRAQVCQPPKRILCYGSLVLAAATFFTPRFAASNTLVQRAAPSFSTSARLVWIPLQVFGPGGQPVLDLQAADFAVRDAGRPVSVEILERCGQAPAGDEGTGVLRGATDKRAPERTLAIFVDDIGARPTWIERARGAALRLLDSAGAVNRVVLVAPASGISATSELPAGRAALLGLIEKIAAVHLASISTVAEAQAIYRWRLDEVVRTLTTSRAFTSLVILGASLPYAHGGSSRTDYERILEAARETNTTIYFLNYVGQQPGRARFQSLPSADPYREDGTRLWAVPQSSKTRDLVWRYRPDPSGLLGAVAVDSGGLAFPESNDLGPAVDRVLTELRADYLLGFEPTGERSGYHTLEVQVRRKGVKVRARRGWFAGLSPQPALPSPPK